MASNKESIALTIQSIRGGISKFYKKASKRREIDPSIRNQVNLLVEHLQHLLIQLSLKRQSLKGLIAWFQQEWKSKLHPSLKTLQQNQNESSLSTLMILQHVLEVFIRCQDGLVLLTSGECRHEGDIREASDYNSRKYQSKLSLLEARNDGYTCLYKTNAIYSGFGWDEYANETVGIQVRLNNLLKKCSGHKHPWDWLENHDSTSLLDALLDNHECIVKELQQTIQTLKLQVSRDIKSSLTNCSKFSFVTQDKMERLVVSYGQHSIRLERRADSFQLGLEGVLPKDKQSLEDWDSYSIMPKLQQQKEVLPSNTTAAPRRHGVGGSIENINKHASKSTTKRRRLTIMDSDDDDDNGGGGAIVKKDQLPQEKQLAPSKKNKTTVSEKKGSSDVGTREGGGGLLVTIHKVANREEVEDSVATIKNQMGVNSNQLEVSREIFEKETHQEEEQYLRTQEYHLSKYKNILSRALNRSSIDENEVWDARECLRQSYMELGNEYLSRRRMTSTGTITTSSTSKDKTTKYYENALACYQNAKRLIGEQQQSHHATKDETIKSKSIERNLLFLLARSSINIGIVYIEWGMNNTPTTTKSSTTTIKIQKINKGIQEFRTCRAIADKLRQQAQSDEQRILSSSFRRQDWIEAVLDIVRANQIESLACRWIGIATWPPSSSPNNNKHTTQQQHQYQDEYKEAINMLQKASTLWHNAIMQQQARDTRGGDYAHYSDDILQEVLGGAAECFYATSALTDLACEAMEKIIWAQARSSSSSSSKSNHNSNNYKINGDKLLLAVSDALQRHSQMRHELDTVMSDKQNPPSFENAIQSFLEEEKIVTSKEILIHLQSIKTWWEQQIQNVAECSSAEEFFGINLSRTQQFQRAPRSDVFPSLGSAVLPPLNTNTSGEPVVRILAKETPRFSKQRRNNAGKNSSFTRRGGSSSQSSGGNSSNRIGPGSFDTTSMALMDDNNIADGSPTFHQPLHFRKWGDELLTSSLITDRTATRVALAYPTIAPEMPAGIRKFLDEQQQKQ